jgi:hypothetical protein
LAHNFTTGMMVQSVLVGAAMWGGLKMMGVQ